MKPRAIIDRAGLARALSAVSGAIEKRMSIPILSHALIKASDGRLSVQGTNCDLFAEIAVPAEASTPWSATCQHEPLARLVSALPEGSQVELAPEDGRVAVRAGRTSAKFPSLPVDGFPSAPEVDGGETLTMAGVELARLLSAPAPFIDAAANAKAPRGIWLHQTGDKRLRAVGASASGLCSLLAGAQLAGSAIIPQDTAGVFASALNGRDGDVTLALNETLCRLIVDGLTLTSKLIGDPYPEYWNLIPDDLPVSLTFDGDTLRDTLRRLLALSDVSSDTYKFRALTFDVSEGGAVLSTSDRINQIETQEQIDCEAEPAQIKFTLNGGRVQQLLATLDAETVRFRANEARSLFLIEPVGKAADGVRMTAALRF